MNADQVSKWGKSLLLKIHVITGWTIPEAELLNILIDQFQKKLVENYGDVNPEEVEYAFRNFGTRVKDWGKAMNLSLIDEVMLPYLGERERLSRELEERKLPPPEQRIYSQEEIDNDHRYDAEMFYQRLRKGMIPKVVPDYILSIMKKDGLINDDKSEQEVVGFFSDRLNKGFENIYVKEE